MVGNAHEIFGAVSEFLGEDQCREQLICETYQRKLMDGVWGFDHFKKFLEFFPVFYNAKIKSFSSKSRSEGCSYNYPQCVAMSKIFRA